MDEEDHEIVKIVEICKVHPLPSPCEPKLLPLTFFDIILLSLPSTSRLYFYQYPNPNHVLPNLKHSLSLILTQYFPLVGNLTWPRNSHKPIIQFLQNDAVSLTVAESNLDFHHLSCGEFRRETNYCPLVPQLPTADNRIAAMALQVTIFPNEGFSIGITTHHVVVDGNISTSFMKSWARVCNDVTNLNLITQPCYDRTKILNDTAHLEPTSLDRTLKLVPFEPNPNWYRTTLELTSQDLEKLKNWALNYNTQDRTFNHVSSFTITLAYLLVCRAKMEGLRNGKMQCLFPVDARSRVQPPLPSNYFGNCLISGCVIVDRNEIMGENGILVAIEEILKAIKQSLEGGILKGLEKKKDSQSKLDDEDSMEKKYCVGSSPKFGVYSANFGWGKPVKVEFLTMSSETFALSDGKNGDGGIEIGLVGERNELERIAALFTLGLQGL